MFSPETLTGVTPTGVIALVIVYLFVRVSKLESRLDKAVKDIATEADARNRVLRLLERVSTGYEAVRRELLKVAHILRDGGEVSESHLKEIETTPPIEDLLKRPIEEP